MLRALLDTLSITFSLVSNQPRQSACIVGLVVVLDRGQSDIWKFRISPFFINETHMTKKKLVTDYSKTHFIIVYCVLDTVF